MKINKHDSEPNVIKKFADILGTEVKNRRVEIPEKFGKGYCAGYVFNENIRMLILNYELNEDLVIKNPDMDSCSEMILFKFQNIFPAVKTISAQNQVKAVPSVLIATRRMNTDVVIPIHTNTAAINIEVDAKYLNGLFDLPETSPVLQSLLQNRLPLLFEQIIYPSVQRIVDQILTESVKKTFELFFLRVKAEELICRLLIELEKREEKHLYSLNINDIQTVYRIKEQILEHLEIPPVIKELSGKANMSASKLKRLFKQIFGSGIFSYYQEFRMKEAARLLQDEKLSVSETGYRLGFTNLSHFSKTFNLHIGMKPKQFSRS